MGMNRKWNMKVFELHDSDGGQGGGDQGNIPEAPINDDVYVDTSGSSIIMSKYPFTAEGMLPPDADPSSILEINLSDLTKDPDFTSYVMDATNWHFMQGNSSNIQVDTDNNKLTFKSIVKTFLDLPTDSPKWVLKFNLKTDEVLYRNFFYFDGVEDETQTTVRYQYGIDIPTQGYPHLEHITNIVKNNYEVEVVEQTIADEQYFTGSYAMPVVVTRWNNVYTLYYDNRYMITIPTENDTLNRIGFWSWSGAWADVTDMELYIIDDDSNATNIIINANTEAEPEAELEDEYEGRTLYNFTKYADADSEEPIATGTFIFAQEDSSSGQFIVTDCTDLTMEKQAYWMTSRDGGDGVTRGPCYPAFLSNEILFYITYEKQPAKETPAIL